MGVERKARDFVSKITERILFILVSMGFAYASLLTIVMFSSRIEYEVNNVQLTLLAVIFGVFLIVSYYYHKKYLPRKYPLTFPAILTFSTLFGVAIVITPIHIYRIHKLPKLTGIRIRMRTLLNQGVSHLDEDRYEEAIDSFEGALEEVESASSGLPPNGLIVSKKSVDIEAIKDSVADLISEIEIEKEKAVQYEKTKSSVEDAECILDEAETNVNQNRISEALDNIEELHSAVDHLPEDVSKYDMKQEVREIKRRCDELIVELREQS